MNYRSEDIERACKMMDEASGILGRGPLSYYLREMNAAFRMCIERFSPFKAGDRVRLAKTPTINEKESWGWMSAKHFLVKGAKATVQEVGCGEGGFTYTLVFDDETWIHPHTKEKMKHDKPHHYTFGEKWLVTA